MMPVLGHLQVSPVFTVRSSQEHNGERDSMFSATAFLHYDILVHFLEGSCSTSFTNKIDKDFFPSIISSITFTRRLEEKVQIRVL